MAHDSGRSKDFRLANNGSYQENGDKGHKVGNAFKHGLNGTTEHKAWSEAKQRCHNPNNDKYQWYGARGISVCAEWRNDFMAFYSHIGPKPSPEYEIDRIDNDRGYEPGNVRWATRYENVMNRRNTVFVVYKGERMLLDRYAEIEGIPYATAWARAKYHPHMLEGFPSRSGKNQPAQKLTDEQANEIRQSKEKTKILMQRYGVSRSLIQGIRRGTFRRSISANQRSEAKNL